jgi:hypothetical protein
MIDDKDSGSDQNCSDDNRCRRPHVRQYGAEAAPLSLVEMGAVPGPDRSSEVNQVNDQKCHHHGDEAEDEHGEHIMTGDRSAL